MIILIVLLSEAQWSCSGCGKAIMPNEMPESDHESEKVVLILGPKSHKWAIPEIVRERRDIVGDMIEIVIYITEIVQEAAVCVAETIFPILLRKRNNKWEDAKGEPTH
jgi:hypothetical protein